MAADFDPYHVWLGIPPEDQPANHYRLLGIRLFETNGDVIDNAADRQMAHLRTYQGGKHGELTQQLLNEVAAARVCLLDPKKRAKYDKQLQAELPAAPPPSDIATGGSAVRRTARAAGVAPAAPNVAAAPQPVDQWAAILGDASPTPAHRPGSKSAVSATATTGKATAAKGSNAKSVAAKGIAAKRDAKNRNISIAIAAAVVLAAVIGIGLASLGSSDGTLVFDWPLADRPDISVKVDNVAVPAPATGPWEYHCSPGQHHLVAYRPAYKLDTNVAVVAGEQKTVPADWKPKATLVFNWPLVLRPGADLRIDGRAHAVTEHDPLEIAVEPGPHEIRIVRRGVALVSTRTTVADGGRELIAIAPPPEPVKLVFDWPADQRKDAELTVDGRTVATGSDAGSFELIVEPGQHVVQITRSGFEPFNQSLDLAAGGKQSIKPTWKPLEKAPMVVEAPVHVEAPQPAKKLPIPPAAEQERIAKELDALYKTSRSAAGGKDPAKAQELYDVAAKPGASPAERYMLLMKGAEIAAAGADLNLSMQGIDALNADFEIDALEAKQKLVERFIAAGKANQVAPAIQTAEQLVDQAVGAGQYEIARVLATTASHAAAKSMIPDRKAVEERLSRLRHDIGVIQSIYATTKKAEEALVKNPADPDANSVVGRWRCFYKADWTGGLPLLAKGSDEKLAAIAQRELKAPADADQQIQLADAWWDLAQKEAGSARDSLHLHAGAIYQAALPNLGSALKKAGIEKRLAEIAGLKPIMAAAPNDANPAGNPAMSVKFPLNRWVNVLPLIDTTRDRISGTWQRKGDELTCEAVKFSKIELPVAVDGGYDFEVEFTRTTGQRDIAAAVAVGSHTCTASLSAAEGGVSGLMDINGHNVNDTDDPIVVRPGAIENGRRYRLLISVRILADDRASIDVSLDGKTYFPHWEGDPASLGNEEAWQLPDPKRLGLGANESDATFHSARLRMVSGHASCNVIAESALPPFAPLKSASGDPAGKLKFPLGTAVEILPLVDTAKHVVAGRWSRDGEKITVEPDNQSRIVIPVAVAGSYDLQVELNRHDGAGDLYVDIPVGAFACGVMMGQDKHLGGLDTIEGIRAYDDNNHNPTTVRSPEFENDHTYQLSIKVRLRRPDVASVETLLDGKPYFRWEGNPSVLSLASDWAMPTLDHLGLGAWRSQVTFSSVKLRMVAGRALDDPASASSVPTPP